MNNDNFWNFHCGGRFRFFVRSPLENLSTRTGRKLSENDQRGSFVERQYV